MASSYSTDLKIELMVTGEKDNQWGDITNTNLNLVQQAIAGFESIAITSTNTTLLMTDGTLSNARNAVLRFTGAITANCTVFVASGIEKTYTVDNATTGAFTVALNQVGGSSVIFEATDKSHKLVYLDGTNANDILDDLSTIRLPNQNEVRFGDADNSHYVSLRAGTTVASNLSFTLPTADGTANQVLTTDGSGALSFATVSGGAAWQAVKTTGFTAVAKEGYFCNTTSAAFTATLPASATIGDFISFIDYAGTFDTNNLTIGRNGHNIQGSATDLTVATERAGFTLVYVDATQGWLLQNN